MEGARTWHESDGKASGWLAEELGAVDSCSQVVPCEASADPEVPGSILSAWFSWDIFVGALARLPAAPSPACTALHPRATYERERIDRAEFG